MDSSPRRRNTTIIVLSGLLLLAAFGVVRTRPRPVPTPTGAARRAPLDPALAVDQSSLITVEQLLRLPTAPEERSYAQGALRLADQEVDLAFAQAARQAATRPRANNAQTQQLDARLQQGRVALAADKADVARLTALVGTARPADVQPLGDRLNLAKAMAALDSNEVEDAEDDLVRAGGDPQARMQAMVQQHEATVKSFDSVHVTVTAISDAPGLIHRVSTWQALHDKTSLLDRARHAADSTAAALKQRHDRLEARRASRLRDTTTGRLSHDSAAALVVAAQREALTAKTLTTLDQRVDVQHQLSDDYAGWMDVVAAQQRAVVNRILRGIMVLLAIVLVGVLLARWADRALEQMTVERRRAQTLHMVSRVTLQVLGVLVALLVVFGPPNNLGTFLGLAGAGLTVALQDFIVGFIGWFVLMGRDGIRIGDLVEINGVTGEVVELGMFHTVLLETGAWSGSASPTGRRVTFSNSFAIEGHYFNFSTTGQWLWDEVQVVVPDGRDPYPVAESLQAEVEEATAESARQAEVEWRGARRAPQFATLTATPSVHLRPIPGGVEITVRYVTRISERAELRGRLYRSAMQLLAAAR